MRAEGFTPTIHPSNQRVGLGSAKVGVSRFDEPLWIFGQWGSWDARGDGEPEMISWNSPVKQSQVLRGNPLRYIQIGYDDTKACIFGQILSSDIFDVHRGDEFDIFRLFWESLLNFRCTVFSNEYHTSRIWYQCLRWNMTSNWETYLVSFPMLCCLKKGICEVVLYMMQYTLEVPLFARHLCNNSSTYPGDGDPCKRRYTLTYTIDVHAYLGLGAYSTTTGFLPCTFFPVILMPSWDVHRGVFESSVWNCERNHDPPKPYVNLWGTLTYIFRLYSM